MVWLRSDRVGGVWFLLFLLSGFSLSGAVLAESLTESLIKGARKQIGVTVGYDPAYRRLDYPDGDVPLQTGVCTDVIVRAYRVLGIDLQRLVHEDMSKNFTSYPSKRIWDLSRPDRNIDHRRVPNLQTFFSRNGLRLTENHALLQAKPGDMLTWKLTSGLPHIGIVSERRSEDGMRPLIIHNIGQGTREEDMANDYQITGWYRYPKN